MVSFDDFRSEWETHRIGDDSLVASHEETNETKYQCVSLIKQYVRECYQLEPGAWGNAIQWWTITAPVLLTKFTKDASGNVQKGDIVILRTLGTLPGDYSGYGHIGIATGNGDPNSVEILEQNGMGSGTGLGQDAIRTRFIPRNRLAGVLRPIPVAPVNPILSYEPKAVHTLQTNKQPTTWWNLNGTTTDINSFHPAAVLNIGAPFPVGGVAHHINGRHYAMSPEDFNRAQNGDMSTNNGVNLDDLSPIPPVPVVPPPPAAPVAIPLAERYPLDVTVMYFGSANDAKRRDNAQGTVDKGTYYVVGRDEQAVKLSKDNKSDIGWINTFDNKVETPKPIVVATPAVVTLPVDAPPVHDEVVDASDNSVPIAMAPIADITPNKPKPQYQWINNHAAQTMVSTNSIPITVHDLEGKYPDQQLPPNWRGEFSMYATVNGQTYYLPDKMRKAGWFFGINANMLKPVQQAKLDLNNDGRVNIADAIGIGGFIMTESKRAYTRLIAPVITDFKTEKAQIAKQRITKAIDGFSAGRKGKK